jgi:3-oxoacyl-[acyl-carrier protein] reductase
MNNMDERIAIITGGTSGIGFSIAKKLAAEEKYKLALIYSQNEAVAESAQQNIKKIASEVIVIKADVADEKKIIDAFVKTEKAFGGIDVVVNSAGIMMLSALVDLDLKDLDRIHRTNIRGAFVVNQQAAKHVRSGGAIINLSSSVNKLSFPMYAAYAASKGAVDAMVPIFAKELRGKNITVNAVAPGPTATKLFFKGKDEETIERLSKASPLERLGSPDDIAEVVAFLAGPARWINGQIIYANGGII